jgi:hypothetical protein
MKKTCFYYLLLIASSCGSSNNETFKIDPLTLVGNQITLSEIAVDIEYFPLENSFPMGFTYKLIITKDNIYLSVKDFGIAKFNRDGKFLQKIGKIGRGPGEYIYGFNFAVDERTRNVYILDRSAKTKVYVYSGSGKFLRDFSLAEIDESSYNWTTDIEIYNSLLFLPNSLGQGTSKYNWIFLDTLGNLVEGKVNPLDQFYTNSGRDAIIYRFDNKLFYLNYFNDTIYSISPDLKYKAEYLIANGDFRWPRKKMNNRSVDEFISQLVKLFQPGQMFETTHFIVLPYDYNKMQAIAFIEKKTKEIFLALKYEYVPERNATSRGCILNDLDGGIPLGQLGYFSENGNEYLTSLIEPQKLKSFISTDDFKSSSPKYPEKKKELEKLAASLKETDNPVLVLVRLKK